ncbi:hypothetical protein LEP1GSC124_2291 [Leptospira interrogans serovar Pyrogenes str. 200701872]|uniref:Uncharacterized protein n=1 Tax=Leptospira interrogans serovar Pyrogenes str. 200701872 TaxID=1193029 RepID=M7ACJ9_LEPIR|nr:hypothetical protein LEP1GSC124_2291 [Leptospira interrogans serovar Pyrogenes str. 200701872]
MKKTMKMGVIFLVIFTLLSFCKNEQKQDLQDILGILLLKQNSQSEGESLGLTIAFSTRFKKPDGEILSVMNGQKHF